MSLQKVEALIIRNLRYGDTSRIVTVFSRELGKWSGLAKGVRTPKSRFGASLELLNLSMLVCYFRPGRDLKLISEGSLEQEFRGLLQESARYHYACAVAEFCDKILEEEASVPEIFDLTIRVLGLMEESVGERLAFLFSAYRLRVAGMIGYAPRLDQCTRCGSDQLAAFGPAEGGVLCRACRDQVPSSLAMSPPTWQLLRKLGRGALPREVGSQTVEELSALADAFLSFHIDRYRNLRSLRSLRDLAAIRAPSAPAPTPRNRRGSGCSPEPASRHWRQQIAPDLAIPPFGPGSGNGRFSDDGSVGQHSIQQEVFLEQPMQNKVLSKNTVQETRGTSPSEFQRRAFSWIERKMEGN